MFNDCSKPHSICMRLVLSTQEEFSLKRAHYGHSPLRAFHKSWVGWHLCTCARAHTPPPPSPYLTIRLTNFAKIWCVAVTKFTKVGGGMTAHSHVRLQFRCLRNRSALTLKPHQNQTYLFQARSFIAKHSVLLVYTKNLSMSGPPACRPAVVTLLRGLYLWNRKPDWQAVFFGG